MEVLQITTNYPNSSNPIFGIFMKEQIEALEKYGVTNTVFFSDASGTRIKRDGGGTIVHLKSVFKLQWHLLTHHYDIIHCHSSISGLILLASGAAFFNKCVVSFQNDPTIGTDGTFFKLLYNVFNISIVKSTSILGLPKLRYIPNGVDMGIFRPLDKIDCKNKLGLDVNIKYILFVDSNSGKKRVQKRKDRFDETLRILRDNYGYDNLAELVMIGVNREDVPIWINACDLHLLCSDQEGSPNSVKECLSCNVPCVTTNVGNTHDMLDDAPACFVSDRFEPTELAYLIDKSFRYDRPDKNNLRQLIIEKELDKESVSRKIYELYENLQ